MTTIENHTLLFENLDQGVVYHDGEGYIINANTAAQKILGLSLKQMQGLTSIDPNWKAIHPDGTDFPGETHPSMHALKTGKPLHNVEMGVFQPKDNAYRWININAFPLFKEGESLPASVMTIFEDITNLKETQENLNHSINRISTLLDANPDIMFVISSEGIFVDYQTHHHELLYSSPDVFMGKKLEEVLPPEIADLTRKKIKQTLQLGETQNETYELFINNRQMYFESRYVKYSNNEVLAIVRDFTKQKEAENSLIRKKKITETLALASQYLLKEEKLEIIISKVLEEIGRITEQDRVNVFEFYQEQIDGKIVLSKRFEWVNTGISSQIGNPQFQNQKIDEVISDWYNKLSRREQIYGNTSDFPQIERQILEAQSIISILMVPIFVEGIVWGFIGFDNCHSTSNWDNDEIAILSATASSLGMAINRNNRNIELEKAKKLLEEREERFRLIINNSSDVLGIINPNGTYQYISEAVEAISGYSNSDLTGISFMESVHPDDLKRVYKAFIESLENPRKVLTVQYKFIHKTKSWIHVETVGLNLIGDPLIRGILISVRDISKRKETEDALKKSEERYAMVLDATEQGIWDWNVLTNEVFYSEQWKKQLGYTDKELENKFETWQELLHPEDKEVSEKAVVSYLEQPEGKFILDFRLKHKDGSYRWIHNNAASKVDETGNVIRMFGAHTDVTQQKNAELALKESEAFLNILLDTLPIPFFYKDMNGKYLGFNKSFEDFFGKSKEELIGKSVFDINPPDLAAIYHAKDKELFEQRGIQVYESNVKSPLGYTRDVIFSKASLTNANGEIIGLIGTILDITERKKTEETLKLSEQKYKQLQQLFRNVADNMPDMLWAKDLENRYIFVNKATCENLLCTTDTDEPVGKSDMFFAQRERLSHPDYPEWHTFGEICAETDLIVVKSGKSGQFDEFGNVKNKFLFLDVIKTPLLNEKGEMIGTVGSGRNVTERKRDEKILKIQYNIAMAMVSVSNLKQLLDIVVDELGQLIDTRNFFVALYNKPKDTLRRVIWRDEMDDYEEWAADNSLSGQVVKQARTILLNREQIDRFELEMKLELHGSPALCWLGVPLGINDKVFGAIVIQSYTNTHAYDQSSANLVEIIAREISIFIEKQRIMDDLVDAKEKAEESERLKTAFLQNMSHEIRTPMNAISGFSQLLNQPNLGMEKIDKYTSIIINSGNQLLSIVNNILTISAIETNQEKVNLEIVNLNEIINELHAIFKVQALNKNLLLTVRTSLNDKYANILTDKTKLNQILSNLIINAFKFTHKGNIDFGYKQEKDELVFFVADTGIGIKPSAQEKIFDRFMQADKTIQSEFGGAGLGLSISKGLASLLGGRIWLESEPGKGSTFYLAIAYKQANETMDINRATTEISANSTILIAEDQENNFFLLNELLKDTGLKILHAKNGKEALNICSSEQKIDLVLMDIKMPEMDGQNAAMLIKKIRPALPIIAQTAYALEQEIKKYKGKGFDDYITKPIQTNELIEKIQKFIQLK